MTPARLRLLLRRNEPGTALAVVRGEHSDPVLTEHLRTRGRRDERPTDWFARWRAELERCGVAERYDAFLASGMGVVCWGEPGYPECLLDDPDAWCDKDLSVQALADRLGRLGRSRVRAVGSSDPAGFDLVVNASPLGLRACDPLPCDVARMDAGAALVDILMKNQPTPAVRAARARALVAQPGFEMMIQIPRRHRDRDGVPPKRAAGFECEEEDAARVAVFFKTDQSREQPAAEGREPVLAGLARSRA